MTKVKNWKLLKKDDVSPSPFFPLEKRTYQRPDGEIVDDFYVTTLADSVHIVPVTTDGRFILIRMYKQGVDQIVVQFPAGRLEKKHLNLASAACTELEEETGIRVKQQDLIFVAKYAIMTTKSSEFAYLYLAKDATFNSQQILDDNEEIEILTVTPSEIETMITDGIIIEGLMIANWYLIKKKFPEIFINRKKNDA